MMHVVDDDNVVREVLVELMEVFGFQAQGFASSEAYLEYVSSSQYIKPLAVFSDVLMPGLDGFRLMRRVQAKYADVRFVMISGEDSRIEQSKLGACIYLGKPIHPESEGLLTLLRELLASRHA